VQGTIEAIERLDYAQVDKIKVKVRGGLVSVEIPVKVLEAAGWTPKKGDKVLLELTNSKPDKLDQWDIVMGGYVYLKKEEENKIYASLGGLKLEVVSEKLYPKFKVDEKVYILIKSGVA